MIVFLYDGLLLLFLTITCFGNGRKCDQNYSVPIKVDETFGRFSHNLIFTLPLMFIYPLVFCNFNYFSYSDTSSSDLIYLIFFLILLIPFAIYTAIDWIWDPFPRLDEDARPTSGYKYLYLMKYTFGILPFVVLMILFSGLNSVAEILSVANLIVIYIFVCASLFILDSVKLDSYKSKNILSIISLAISVISFVNLLFSNSITYFIEYGDVNYLITPLLITAISAVLLVLFLLSKKYIGSSLYQDDFKYNSDKRIKYLGTNVAYFCLICITKVIYSNYFVVQKVNLSHVYLTFLIVIAAIITSGISLIVLRYGDAKKTKVRKVVALSSIILLFIELVAFYNLYSSLSVLNGTTVLSTTDLVLFIGSLAVNISFMIMFALTDLCVTDFKYTKWHEGISLLVPILIQGIIVIAYYSL